MSFNSTGAQEAGDEGYAAFAYCGDAGSGGRWGGRRGVGGSEEVDVVV
jgi:hypothetical protein